MLKLKKLLETYIPLAAFFVLGVALVIGEVAVGLRLVAFPVPVATVPPLDPVAVAFVPFWKRM